MRRDVLWNKFFTPRCEISFISRPLYSYGLEYEVGYIIFMVPPERVWRLEENVKEYSNQGR